MLNKRGEETRQLIRDCACRVFVEKGFKQVTMKDICEAAQLSRGGLYCHYESTEQIFKEIIDLFMVEQDNEIDSKIKLNLPAVTLLDDLLEKYKKEMMDSRSSLSIAIYEYYSIHHTDHENNALYKQYLASANAWEKLIRYGIARNEFHHVDISAVFDLIVFSYQGVRMYSTLMTIDEKIPAGIIRQIKKIIVRSDENGNDF